MSMGTWVLVAWAVLVVAPFVTGAVGFHYGRHHERTEGKHRRTAETLDREYDEWRARMRAPWDEPVIRAKTYPLPRWHEPPPGMGLIFGAPWGDLPKRAATTAADLPEPVVVPEPKLTDTGELRAIGERGAAIRAAMVTGELAWSEKNRLIT